MSTPSFTQLTHRIRNDDGTETTATWKQTQGTDASILTGQNFRVRFRIDETASVAWTNITWNLRYSLNGGAYTAVSGSTPVQFSASANFADGADTTTQLTGGTGTFVTDNNGMKETTGGATNSGSAGNLFELEWCVRLDVAQLASGNTIDLRVYNGTSAIAAYTDTPRVTVLMARTLTADAGVYNLTGNAATLKRGLKLVATAGSYALSGNTAGLAKGYRVAAAAGSYGLTGNSNSLRWDHRLVAAAGSYALSGNAAGLARKVFLTAAGGSYALTGNSNSLLWNHKLAAAAGAYSVSGNNAALLRALRLAAAAGVYNLTGNTVDLIAPAAGEVLAADVGSYGFSGNSAQLRWNRRLAPDAGAYCLSGNNIGGVRTYILNAQNGAYAFAGNDIAAARGYRLLAGNGAYVITGLDVGLTQGVAPALPGTLTLSDSIASTLALSTATTNITMTDVANAAASISDNENI